MWRRTPTFCGHCRERLLSAVGIFFFFFASSSCNRKKKKKSTKKKRTKKRMERAPLIDDKGMPVQPQQPPPPPYMTNPQYVNTGYSQVYTTAPTYVVTGTTGTQAVVVSQPAGIVVGQMFGTFPQVC